MSYELVGSFRCLLFLFGPLNALLHVYLYYTSCFPLVICIISLPPVHMVSHHLYCTTALSIKWAERSSHKAYRIHFSTVGSFCQWYHVPPRMLAKVHARLRKIQGRGYNASSGGAPFWGEELVFQTCRFCHFQWTWNQMTTVSSCRLQTYCQWLWLSSGGCEIHISQRPAHLRVSRYNWVQGQNWDEQKRLGVWCSWRGRLHCGCIIITWYQWWATLEESGPSTFWEDLRNTCYPLATSCWWSRSWRTVWVIGSTVELAQTT